MRIYLAGKITKNGWRNTIFTDQNITPSNRSVRPDFPAGGDINMRNIDQWPISKGTIFGIHDYTGPYFISDDHGSAHGENTHGVSAGVNTETTPELDGYNPSKRQVNKLAIKAIELSDLIFVWIDEVDCYGTIAEIGYAAGKGKLIHIAGKFLPELWFVYNLSNYDCDFKSTDPRTALQSFLISDRKIIRKV